MKHHNTTTLLPGTPEHRQTMTASKIGAALGISPFQSPASLWLLMTNRIDPDPTTPPMRRGHNQEASILEWFFTELHPELTQLAGETTWTHPGLPWAASNTDAHAVTPGGEVVFVEAKSIARDSNKEWGKPGTDQIPLTYFVQVMWQMHMTHHPAGEKVTRTYVVKHGPFVDQYDVYPIDYDLLTATNIEQRAHTFWLSVQDPDGCPEPSNMVGEHQKFSRLHADIEPDFDWEISLELATEYILAKDDKKDAQAREDGAKARILKAMGTARTAMCNGVTIGYRRPTKNGVSFYPPQRAVTLKDINPNIETQEEA